MVDARIRIWGKPLRVSGSKAPDGRDRLFWHLITSGTAEGTEETRRLDLKRCACLPLVWDVLERLANGDPRVCWWRESKWTLVVAPVDFSLLVVLSERRGAYSLRTAYPTLSRKRRRAIFERASRACAGRPFAIPDLPRHRVWADGAPWPVPHPAAGRRRRRALEPLME
jgi:hypothetical protein